MAVSICAGLGAAEGLTRLFLPAFDPSGQFDFDYQVGDLYLATPGAISRQKKNTGDFDVAVRINRRGLRDDKDVAQATGDDIIVVGDSFAWGWGVEAGQRFSDLVQKATRVRVFNVSTPTDLEGYIKLLQYARTLGAAPPRLVIVAVCMENDIRLYGDAQRVTADRPGSSVIDLRLAISRWLAERSAAYVLAVTVIHQTPWLYALGVRAGFIVPNLEGMSRNDDSPEEISSSADKVREIAAAYRTLVLLIPSRGLWVGQNRSTEDKVHRSLVSALRERGIDILDLRGPFEAGSAPMQYHFANDGHWNDRGHALAAEAIAARLR